MTEPHLGGHYNFTAMLKPTYDVIKERFNIKLAVESLKIPFLVIHGENDHSVLPFEGNDLNSWAKNSEFFKNLKIALI